MRRERPGTWVRVIMGVLFLASTVARAGNTSRVELVQGTPRIVINGRPVNHVLGVSVYCAGVDPRQPVFLTQMREAVDRTSRLGIPLFTFDVLWSDYDRSVAVPGSPGEAASRFEVAALDAILDHAAARRVGVVVQLPLHAHAQLPAWWLRYRGNSGGRQLVCERNDDERRYNFMQQPIASYGSPDHRALLGALITRLVRRYRNHPAVVGWAVNPGPTGENGYGPSYIDQMFNPDLPRIDMRTVMADYSGLARARFQEWLQFHYRDVRWLSQSWGFPVPRFDLADPPTPLNLTPQDVYAKNGDCRRQMLDWQWFRHDLLVSEWRFLSDCVRREDPTKIVIGKGNWEPSSTWLGASGMCLTASEVNRQRIIDVDKCDVGLMPDDSDGRRANRRSYEGFIRFNQSHGTVRIVGMENWHFDAAHRLGPILPERARAVRDSIRDRFGYMWPVVSLACDTVGKPAWRWNEVESLALDGPANLFPPVEAPRPRLLFYHDVANLMPHYAAPAAALFLETPRLIQTLQETLVRHAPALVWGYADPGTLRAQPLDPRRTPVIVLANERMIPEAVLGQLGRFVAQGGTLLMLGFNGLFDDTGRPDPRGVATLTRRPPQEFTWAYAWDRTGPDAIPAIVVSPRGVRTLVFPIGGSPDGAYGQLRAALDGAIPMSPAGRLEFSR